MKTKYGKRFLAWMLASSMVISSVPQSMITVAAEEIITDDGIVTEWQEDGTEEFGEAGYEVDDLENIDLEYEAGTSEAVQENTGDVIEEEVIELLPAEEGSGTPETETQQAAEDGYAATAAALDDTGLLLAVEPVGEAEMAEVPQVGEEGLEAVLLSDGSVADFRWYEADKKVFKLSTAEEVRALAELIAHGLSDDGYGVDIAPDDFSGKTIKLAKDLELGAWTAIGTKERPFAGTFDGQDHTISYTIKGSEKSYQGLFAYNSGTIRNLKLTGSMELSKSRYLGGIAAQNDGTIENVHTSMTFTMDDVHVNSSSDISAKNGYYIGGIAAINNGTIADCSNSGTISGGTFLGGIAGWNYGTITGCKNSGTIICKSLDCVYNTEKGIGGIAGVCTGTAAGSAGLIENCANTGKIEGYFDAGGITGFLNSGTIRNCYNTALITGCWNNAGIAGGAVSAPFFGNAGRHARIENCYNTGEAHQDSTLAKDQGITDPSRAYNYCAGIVGFGWNQDVYNCYNAGYIHGKMQCGGIIGGDRVGENGSVNQCYNMGTVTGNSYFGGIAGWVGGSAMGSLGDYQSDVSAENAKLAADQLNAGVTEDNGYFGWVASGTTVAFGNVYRVSFTADPENAVITVKYADGNEAVAAEKNVWILPDGTYSYTVSCEDYQKKEGTFTVAGTGLFLNVSLEQVWNADTDSSWYDEQKSEFVLTNGKQLAGLAELVTKGTDFTGKKVTLGADIRLSDQTWAAIGDADHAFNGIFDGAGYTVSGLSGAALFGKLAASAVVKNLALSGTEALAAENAGTIENCWISTTAAAAVGKNSGTVKNSVSAGTAPLATEGTIDNCYYVNETYTEAQFKDGTVAAKLNEKVLASNGWCPWKAEETGTAFQKSFSAAFVVESRDGSDASAAVVQVFDSEGKEVTEETSMNYKTGAHSWKLVAGEYTYKASLNGYADREGSFVIRDAAFSRRLVMAKRYTYSFTVQDKIEETVLANAVVAVTDQEGRAVSGEKQEDGSVSYSLLAASYNYSVQCEGYMAVSGTFTIAENAETENQTISLKKYPMLRFTLTAEDANPEFAPVIEVKNQAGETVYPNSDATYTFQKNGTYSWQITADGYWTESKTFEVTEKEEENVLFDEVLTICKTYEITLAYAQENLSGASVKVYTADGTLVTPSAAQTYLLKNGTYTYAAEAYGYAAVENEFTVDGKADQVTITFTEDGYDRSWYDKDATELVIADAEDFMAFAAVTNGRYVDQEGTLYAADGFASKTISLTEDLVFSEKQNAAFMPVSSIESGGKNFNGTFKGNGHSITLQVASDRYAHLALFDRISGTQANPIEDLTVKGSITNLYTGKAAAYTAGFTADNWGMRLKNCTNEADITGPASTNSYTAGLGAYFSNGNEFTNCTNSGTITGNGYTAGIAANNLMTLYNCVNTGNVSGGNYTAGIVAYRYGAYLYNCKNEGNVTGLSYTGGLIGYAPSAYLEQAVNEGTVTGTQYVGGIAAYYTDNYSEITENAVNKGDVAGQTLVGGFAGSYDPGNGKILNGLVNFGKITGTDSVGGLIGQATKPWWNAHDDYVQNCYNVGTVEGTGTYVGAICGKSGDGIRVFKNCFYLAGTAGKGCGSSDTEGCTALENMQDGTLRNRLNQNITTENKAKMFEDGADGYPYATGKKAELTLKAVPDCAVFTLKDAAGNIVAPIAEGSSSYADLAVQNYYKYQAVSTSADYNSSDVSVLIYEGTPITQTVNLTSKKYTITFAVKPSYANITVYDSNGAEVAGTNSYALPVGAYSYQITANGYQTVTDTFTVGGEDNRARTISVNMERGAKVTFETNAALPEYQKITVYDAAGAEVTTEHAGIYYLADGTYTYKIEAEGYQTKSGADCTFTVEKKAQTIEADLELLYDVSWYDKDESVYEIADELQMLGLTKIVSGTAKFIAKDEMRDKTVRLTADIELDDTFTPLGLKVEGYSTSFGSFSGNLDGCGHTITMNVDQDAKVSYYGLVYNLSSYGSIRNLTIDGSINNTNITTAAAFVVGTSNGTISNCINKCDITAKTASGMVSRTDPTDGALIENCRNEGRIEAVYTYANNVGGIVGTQIGSVIRNCVNTGEIITAGTYAGGIAGYISNGSAAYTFTIQNCYNTGDVTAKRATAYAGGITSYIFTGTHAARVLISNSYNSGTITITGTKGNAGAIAGYTALGSAVKDCCYLEGSAAYAYYDSSANTECEEEENRVVKYGEKAFADGTAAIMLNQNVTKENGYYEWMVKENQTVFSYGHSLIFEVNPEHAVVTLKDAQGNVLEQSGKNCYAGLTEGAEYTYTAEAEGLNSVSGSVIMGTLPMGVQVNLSATVTFTVSKDGTFYRGYDEMESLTITMTQVPITVAAFDVTAYGFDEAYNSEDGPTLLHAFIKAHELYCPDEGAEGFAAHANNPTAQGNDLFVTEFWNEETSQLNYWVNNQYPGEWLEEEGYVFGSTADNIDLFNGDDVEVDLYSDYKTPMYHSYFDKTSATVLQGQELELTLKGFVSADAYLYQGDPFAYALKGSEIYADPAGTEYENELPYAATGIKTDENGKAVLTFAKPGTYYISAKGTEALLAGDKAVITAPYCTVTVLENKVYGVMEQISKLGTITLESKDAIAAARAAYDALDEESKKQVFNFSVLQEAEAAYEKQTADAEAAAKAEAEAQVQARIKAVMELIDKIGVVSLNSKDAITAARTAYDALSADEQKAVLNYKTLTAAESYYAQFVKAEAEKKAAEEAAKKAEAEKKAAEEKAQKAEAEKEAAEEAAKAGIVTQSAAKTKSITVTWNADKSADAGYRIYIKGGSIKNYTKAADVSASTTSYTIKKVGKKSLSAGTIYSVQVVSLQKEDGKKTEKNARITKAATLPSTPKISSAKRAKKSITLNWKKVTGASGYEIQMSTKKNSGFETAAVVSSAKKSYKVTGLSRKTSYYFRIRTYKTVNGQKLYSNWSAVKKVKTK